MSFFTTNFHKMPQIYFSIYNLLLEGEVPSDEIAINFSSTNSKYACAFLSKITQRQVSQEKKLQHEWIFTANKCKKCKWASPTQMKIILSSYKWSREVYYNGWTVRGSSKTIASKVKATRHPISQHLGSWNQMRSGETPELVSFFPYILKSLI